MKCYKIRKKKEFMGEEKDQIDRILDKIDAITKKVDTLIERLNNSPIPPTYPTIGDKTYPTIDSRTICSECGMEWKGVMSYSCMNTKCPIQPTITSSIT